MVNAIDCATKLTAPMLDKFIKNGVKTFGRYLPTSAWKGLTLEEVKIITQYGGDIFTIYEDNATLLTYFTESQGAHDGKEAEKMALNLGQPKGTPIYFTVDFDVQPKDFHNILKYFKSIKMQHYKVRAYGHDKIIDYLADHGAIDKGYQTYAWSGGRKSKHTVIYQYSNGERMAGIPVDYDKLSGDVGSWNLNVKGVKQTKAHQEQKTHQSVSFTTYKIKEGDTLSKLAAEFKTTVDELVKLNNIKDPDLIVAGNTLKVPVNSPVHSKEDNVYIVKKGDTLSEIAQKFNTTVGHLVNVNGIKDKDLIYPGQKIKY